MSHLRAGDLNRLVSVQSRATSQDSFGGQSTTWTEIEKVFAHVEALTARELLAGGAMVTDVSHQITVRYDAIWADPKAAAGYRVVWNNRAFNIKGLMNEDERDRIVTLLASEGLSQG